ncbi:MAG: thiamine phosphate synthase [Methylococcales bacterium]|nr:thiamine phosphate synthase [Methylococcales bacterium]
MLFPKTGLYAITQTDDNDAEQVIADVATAIKGGAVVIQYRDKSPIDAVYLSTELLKLCRRHHIPLLINDDIQLAATIGADGVHLGNDDGDIEHARHQLGDQAIIGISCYNDIQYALTCEKKGASYVAFGRFFTSSSKPLAAPAAIETLTQAKAQLTLPIVAIGGILPENGGELLTAGADVLAVIGGLFNKNIEASSNAYQPLFIKNSFKT